MTAKIYQIWHLQTEPEPSQLDFPVLYNRLPQNPGLDYLFMESNVIANLPIDYSASYQGVLSPNYKQKIEEASRWGRDIASMNAKVNIHFSNQNADILGLCKHAGHSVFGVAEKYHPGICAMTNKVLLNIGYRVNINQISRYPIYFNYFFAKPAVLQDFQETLLKPFIKEAIRHKEFMRNSGYPKPFPENLKQAYNIDYWPFFAFVGERLINLYLLKNQKIKFRWI